MSPTPCWNITPETAVVTTISPPYPAGKNERSGIL